MLNIPAGGCLWKRPKTRWSTDLLKESVSSITELQWCSVSQITCTSVASVWGKSTKATVNSTLWLVFH